MDLYTHCHSKYPKLQCFAYIIFIAVLLSSCAVGPNYVPPPVEVTAAYKEAKGWKLAKPQDDCDRGEWWKIFKDPQLNGLEARLNISNQNIVAAVAQYRQARALVDEARANFFPIVTATASVTRQKQVSGSTSFSSTSTTGMASSGAATTGAINNPSANIFTNHSLLFDASWEPDIWGVIRRTVEGSVAGAQATAAQLAVTRLSAQASLAQFYFQLRTFDSDQRLLNNTVAEYKKALRLTLNRYTAGVAARTDVVQAQTQLETAQSAAINNHINRAKTEHAIAVLIGQPPATFTIAFEPLKALPPTIPIQVPSALLERRPDIAQAERLMAQANAQIGVAIGAYFPTLTLSGTSSYTHRGFSKWFSLPGMSWAVGPQLAETIFDGGLRRATTAAARAAYDSNVALYRQTVLTAFQDVEDNLASIHYLKLQARVQNQAAASARKALELITNQYKAGTASFSDVIIAQTTAYTSERNAIDIVGLEMTSSVGLIKALGGGWDVSLLR